jgi:hypothetical protein
MIIKYDSFVDLKNDFFKNTKIINYTNDEFAVRYFTAESIKIEITKNLEHGGLLVTLKETLDKETEIIESKNNEINFLLNPRHQPHQIFHCMFYSVYILNTIAKKFKDVNINVYVSETFYKTFIDESLPNLKVVASKDIIPINYFKEYLMFLETFDRFNFKIIKNGSFQVNNAICAYIPYTLSEENALGYEDIKFLKEKNIFIEKDKKFKKIYLRRDNFYGRTPENESDLSDYLNSIGFISIRLEEFSIENQIKILENADLIVGFSGSCFTNLAFTKNKKFVIELTHTPKSKKYYDEEEFEQTNNNSRREYLNLRYTFPWSRMINLFGHDVLRLEFHQVDNCKEIVENLIENKHFQYICNMI